jgi:hypothetical protein
MAQYSLCREGEEGISLVEVLVALAILGILLLPLANVFAVGFGAAETSERYTTLLFLAEQKIEEVGGPLRAELKPDEFGRSVAQTGAFPDFPGYRFQVTELPSPEDQELKRVRVLVWADDNGDGAPQPSESSVELVTQITRRPQ